MSLLLGSPQPPVHPAWTIATTAQPSDPPVPPAATRAEARALASVLVLIMLLIAVLMIIVILAAVRRRIRAALPKPERRRPSRRVDAWAEAGRRAVLAPPPEGLDADQDAGDEQEPRS